MLRRIMDRLKKPAYLGLAEQGISLRIGRPCELAIIRKTDLEGIMGLNRLAFPEWADTDTADMQELMASSKSYGILAEAELDGTRQAIAYTIGEDQHESVVDDLLTGANPRDDVFYSFVTAVHPDCQRMGIYKIIKAAYELGLGELGYRWIYLHAIDKEDSVRAAASMGFATVCLRPNFYDEGSDAVLMEKPLDEKVLGHDWEFLRQRSRGSISGYREA